MRPSYMRLSLPLSHTLLCRNSPCLTVCVLYTHLHTHYTHTHYTHISHTYLRHLSPVPTACLCTTDYPLRCATPICLLHTCSAVHIRLFIAHSSTVPAQCRCPSRLPYPSIHSCRTPPYTPAVPLRTPCTPAVPLRAPHTRLPHLQYGRLVDALSVDVCLGLASARGHRHDGLCVRDDAVARVDVVSGQLETLAARLAGPLRAHLSHVQVQAQPPVPGRKAASRGQHVTGIGT